MTAQEPWTVDDATSNRESNPATATVLALNTNVGTVTVANNTAGATPVKAAFESTVSILTSIMVRISVLFPFPTPANRPLAERDDKHRYWWSAEVGGGSGQSGWGRTIYRWLIYCIVTAPGRQSLTPPQTYRCSIA